MTPLRRRLGLAACVVLGVVAATTPALAAPTAAPRSTVLVALTPAAPHTLARLAKAHATSAAAREAAVAATLPTAAVRRTAAGWLTGHGFTVTAAGPFTLTASAPTATVDALLAGGRVPAALRGVVDGVVGVVGQHRWHALGSWPSGVATPSTLTHAYARPSGARGATATVATVQFSGWPALGHPNSGDLADWAAQAGVAVPHVTAVSVNGASVTTPDGQGGDLEVALDQESLLAVAPAAAQRVYVTTNDSVGGIAVWDRILQDVRDGVRITAVSTSWGMCERYFPQAEVDAVEQDLSALAGLGVTVFAASGDSGADDCGSAPGVDYPASSPEVVGVGGTDLTATATGYRETAWDGSGGGVSTVFTRPAWQQSVGTGFGSGRLVPDISSEADPADGLAVLDSAYDPGHWLQVGGTSLAAPTQAGLYAATLAAAGHPDGALVEAHKALYAAPASGFRDVTSGNNGGYATKTGYDLVTGRGAPQWSALSATVAGVTVRAPLASRSLTVPVSVTGSVALPVSGWAAGEHGQVSCADATSSTVPATATLAAGADRRTAVDVLARLGDGSCVTVSRPVTLDRARPVAAAHASVARPRSTPAFRASWSGADPSPASGVTGYRVTLERRVGTTVRRVWTRAYPRRGTSVVTGRGGDTYRVLVHAVDAAGNTSAGAASPWVSVPVSGRRLSRSSGWRLVANRRAYGGALVASASRHTWLRRTVTGRVVSLDVTRMRSGGYAAVYADGHFVRRINLYAATTRWHQTVRLARWRRAGRHTIVIRPLGRHCRAARASTVAVDALLIQQ